MDFTIANSIKKTKINNRENLVIGTHNGIFHSDEVVAIATLCLHFTDRKIEIVRTRDVSILNECNICVDINGGDYDHHQPGFSLKRENGIPYASAGLVWKHFGENLVSRYMSKSFPEDLCFAKEISKKLDELISLVDCEDNGIVADRHCFSYITSFLPGWSDNNPNFDGQFLAVLEITIKVLEQEIISAVNSVMAERILNIRYDSTKYFSNNVLEIPSQTIPWQETIVKINASAHAHYGINFVIFPYPAGGWAAQCVPPSLEEKFGQRVPFPKEWAGQTDKLAEISSVDDAVFCHNGCFFARATTRDGVIKMCDLAMKD